jgi:hypothetical protein
VVAWLALICALAPAHAGVVIGNGAYRHADRLDNPVNRFDLTCGEDLDQRG